MKFKIYILLIGVLFSTYSFSQLSTGDLAFIGYHEDADDQFTWITLADIPGSTQIYFTEKGWNGAGNTWYNNTEGHLLWQAPAGGLSCGTIVHITETSEGVFSVNPGAGTATLANGAWSLIGGDQIFAYQSTTGVEPVLPTFIAGLHWDYNAADYNSTTTWNNGVSSINATSSQIPLGLTNNVNCVSLYPAPGPELDNNRYTGTLTGTSTVLRAAINNRANWTAGNDASIPIDPLQYPSPSVTCVTPCTQPTIPTVTATALICAGTSTTLNISGSLNDATQWSVYTGSCGGTLLGTTTTSSFVVTPGSSTTYFVRGTGGCVTPGSCGSTTISVNTMSTAPTGITGTTTICNGGSTTLTLSGGSTGTGATARWYTASCGGTLVGTGNSIVVSPTSNTTYFVRYEGTCNTTTCASSNVTVNNIDNASFNYGAASYCVNASDPAPTITGLAGGTFSSATAGLSINASTGTIDVSASTPGAHTVTYTTAGACPNSSNVSVTVNALDNASFNYSAASYCTNASDPTPTITGFAGGTFSSTAGLSINASTGTIDVSASTPGTYTITYTTSGDCPNSSNVSVTVNTLDNASFNYSAASYCVNASDPTPIITGLAGGTFSSTAGLSINASTGAIDVSTSIPGTYTVTYTTAGACPNSSNVSVTVNALDNPSFNYGAASYCANASDPTPTITGLAGGTFSSTAGLSINGSTGAIDVSASTPGTYTVTYTTAGVCPNSSNVSVTVNALDNASFNYSTASYCVNAADPTPTITGLAGGTFSSTAGLSINASTGTIDVSASTPGTYTVTYTTAGTCPNSSNVSVTIGDAIPPTISCPGNQTETPNATCNFTLPDYTGLVTSSDNCNPSPSITQSPVAGTLISGTTVITMTSNDGNGNTVNCTFSVILNDVTSPTAVCQNINVYLDGTGNASIVAGDLDGGSTDNCSGLTLSASQTAFTCANIGPNNVTLTVTDGNGNSSNCNSIVTIVDTISPQANATSLSDILAQCSVSSLTAPTANDNCAGSITGAHNASLPITSSTSITWTYDDGNGNIATQTQNVVINDNTAPIADITTLSDILDECSVTSLIAPTATDNCTGTITGTHNASLPITSSTSITWTYDDGNGNITSQIQEVIITPINNGITQIDAVTLSADATGYNYQWVDCNNGNSAISGATNQTYVPAMAGSYACEVDNGICTVTTDCLISTVGITENSFGTSLVVYPNPTYGEVNVNLGTIYNNVTITLFNALAQEITTEKFDSTSEIHLNIAGLPGMYILEIKTEEGKTARVNLVKN